MRIGIDLDGVVCNFGKAARVVTRELFGKPKLDAIQTDWDFQCVGISREEENVMWRYIDNCPNWWFNRVERMPFTDLLEVADRSHDLFFITNRKAAAGGSITEQTKLWMLGNTETLNPTVIVSKYKGKLADALALDYFIDDKSANCEDVYSNSPNTKVYIADATYNQGELPHLPRAKNLDDFLRQIGAVNA